MKSRGIVSKSDENILKYIFNRFKYKENYFSIEMTPNSHGNYNQTSLIFSS